MRVKVPAKGYEIEDILKKLITTVKINQRKWSCDDSFELIKHEIADAQNEHELLSDIVYEH